MSFAIMATTVKDGFNSAMAEFMTGGLSVPRASIVANANSDSGFMSGVTGWFNKLSCTISELATTLGTTGNVILAAAAVVFTVWHVIKGYIAAKDEDYMGLIKHVILAIVGTLVAVWGVRGVINIAGDLNGVNGSANNGTLTNIAKGGL